jgi:hypothetical protein
LANAVLLRRYARAASTSSTVATSGSGVDVHGNGSSIGFGWTFVSRLPLM